MADVGVDDTFVDRVRDQADPRDLGARRRAAATIRTLHDALADGLTAEVVGTDLSPSRVPRARGLRQLIRAMGRSEVASLLCGEVPTPLGWRPVRSRSPGSRSRARSPSWTRSHSPGCRPTSTRGSGGCTTTRRGPPPWGVFGERSSGWWCWHRSPVPPWGAAGASLVERLRRTGIDDTFVDGLRDQLGPGTSALFLLSRDADPELVRPVLARTEATLIQATLDDSVTAELAELLVPPGQSPQED